MKRTKIVLLVAVTIAIFVFAGYFYNLNLKSNNDSLNPEESDEKFISEDNTSDEDLTENAEEKTEAYDFTLNDLDGNEITLSDYKGKVVVLNFWASWCGPCQREMPDFNEMYENDIKDSEDVVLFTINGTDGKKETEESARDFIEKNDYTLPVLLDLNTDVMYYYSIYNIPTTLIIDKEGYIYKTIIGMTDKDTVLKYVDEVR